MLYLLFQATIMNQLIWLDSMKKIFSGAQSYSSKFYSETSLHRFDIGRSSWALPFCSNFFDEIDNLLTNIPLLKQLSQNNKTRCKWMKH